MKCPVCSQELFEVAPAVFQCAHCGAGPHSRGSRPTWALSYVDRISRGKGYEATCVEHRNGTYTAYTMEWRVDGAGVRVGELQTEDAFVLEEEDFGDFCLPVVVNSNKPWEIVPGTVLDNEMFEDSTGRKVVVR